LEIASAGVRRLAVVEKAIQNKHIGNREIDPERASVAALGFATIDPATIEKFKTGIAFCIEFHCQVAKSVTNRVHPTGESVQNNQHQLKKHWSFDGPNCVPKTVSQKVRSWTRWI
jgi:hypothetical protein